MATTTNYDPIYGVTEEGDSIKIDVVDSYSDLRWKLRTDNKFRWNFSQYAINQDLNWYSSFYNRNFLYRYSPYYTSIDLYLDRFWYWDSWYWNYGYGWNTWHPFRSWYHPHYWNESYWFRNNWRWDVNDYAWNHRNDRNVVRVNGRRGSRGVVVTPNGSRGNNIIANPNISINRGRPVPNDVDVVIEKPKRTFIGRMFDKIENSGVRVRTYNNPNSVPSNIRVIPRNNNNWNNNNNFNNRNNNIIRNDVTPPRSSNPVRTYSAPPPSSNISRGSSGGGVQIKSSGRRNN
tara:strand:+ start:225 stop:1091 length:867 start_codon:yes stop_codon:yes gene_type:complete